MCTLDTSAFQEYPKRPQLLFWNSLLLTRLQSVYRILTAFKRQTPFFLITYVHDLMCINRVYPTLESLSMSSQHLYWFNATMLSWEPNPIT